MAEEVVASTMNGQDYASVPEPSKDWHKDHRVHVQEVLAQAWWLCTNPCFCGGHACGACSDPYCLADDKCFCIEGETYTEDVWSTQGLCFSLSKHCCLTCHQSCPPGGGPNDGVPLLACCNMRYGGGETGTNLLAEENAEIMNDTFLLNYCICMGCGVSKCADPYLKSSSKCLCMRSESFTAECMPSDRTCIYSKSKRFCCISACNCPPFGGKADGIPVCACCGLICCGAPIASPEEQPIAGTPAELPTQHAMPA